MKLEDIAFHRLVNQKIINTSFKKVHEPVANLGAMQAQDYPGALWAIGLRLEKASQSDIETAIAQKKIVRTWLMRGTLHFAAAKDLRWILNLLGGQILSSVSGGRDERLGLDASVYKKAEKVFTKALTEHEQLSRDELYELLERAKISTEGQRGYHILWRFGLEGFVCFASHKGKQASFALLDRWVPVIKLPPLQEAAAELANRFFNSHGPASLQDFIRWSGLRAAIARNALKEISSELVEKVIAGTSYWMNKSVFKRPSKSLARLLPGFDEYILGYKDRSAVLDLKHAAKIVPGNNGIFLPTIVVDGQVLGLWKRETKKNKVVLSLLPFKKFDAKQKSLVLEAAESYAKFLNLALEIK